MIDECNRDNEDEVSVGSEHILAIPAVAIDYTIDIVDADGGSVAGKGMGAVRIYTGVASDNYTSPARKSVIVVDQSESLMML